MTMPDTRNRLLRALPPSELEQLWPRFDRVEVRKREVLVRRGAPLVFAYFPEGGLSSNLATTSDGRRIEVGCFGFEGMVSIAAALGSDRAPHEIMVQVGGPWLRISVENLQRAIQISPTLRVLLMRYAHIFTLTLSHTALANGSYSVEERLARWILMCHDRLQGDDLPLTHEFLSLMLGVQRTTVTLAIQALEGQRMIRAKRGLITVLDREQLCRLAGDSYGVAEAEYERLIGPFRDKAPQHE
ncbi:Crp/Fnr family transcriptional regulator [Methylobacterium nodulans]|uniref:Cyclic nucleotide-binding protein n=1 Tax=Methylobacterium nodulans (strain LMG 21967 / CNCM I-2342 / ORS 2060) TaxID=460265 RepID=B8II86_METNO|nr:cyclic nucleotide-binding protein [Methylobacterium nodulans ORS 2060]